MKGKGLMIAKTPPPNMRKIWVGLEFYADLGSTGFYQEIIDKKAKLIKLQNGKLEYPTKQVYRGTKNIRVMFTLPYEKGFEILKSINPPFNILQWYEKRWPRESEFIFSDNEVRVLRE